MSFLPELDVGLWTAWWFSALYLVGNLWIMLFFPRESWKRFFEDPETQSEAGKPRARQKIAVGLSRFLWLGLVVYAVFVPIESGTLRSFLGLPMILVGMACYEVSLVNYASTPVSEPVVKGLYRVSRNPIYLSDFIFWFGVGVFAGSWVIVVVKLFGRVVSHYQILEEEAHCLEKYGDAYRDYMERVPRYAVAF